MRVFLTGGAGFIGSHLCDALIAQGDTPVILDNLSTGQLSNIANIQNKVEVHKGDNRDAALVNKLTELSDHVLHMAAALGVSTILEKTVESVSTNFTGSEVVTWQLQATTTPIVPMRYQSNCFRCHQQQVYYYLQYH
jgi:UDP-glucose 4-epimerase